MNKKLNRILDNMWEYFVASVCKEYGDGDLAFRDAVEDLYFLGLDGDEASETLLNGVPAGFVKRGPPEHIGA